MNRKEKGFTLVEIIGVIVLMGLVITIGSTTINNIKNVSREKLYNEQINRLVSVSKTWAIENTNKMPSTIGDTYQVGIDRLVEEGYLKSNEIIDVRDNSKITGCVEIAYNSVNSYDYSYVTKDSCYDYDTVYTITYDLDGGVLENSNPTSYRNSTPTFLINNPTKAGYSFTGWEDISNPGIYNMLLKIKIGSKGNKYFKAIWTLDVNIVTIDPNGGLYENSSDIKKVEALSFSSLDISVPARNGYVFNGWTVEGYATLEGNTLSINKENVTLTANWRKISALTLNLNGGTSSQGLSHQLVEGASINLTTPTRTGYTFSGWEVLGTSEKITNGKYTMGSNDTIVMALWTPIQYTITYNLNGGTATNPITYTIETSTFTLAIPVKSGYMFAGWTGSNGSTNQIYVTINKGSTGNRTYTANYGSDSYTFSTAGSCTTYSPSITGNYQVEVAGAQGGTGHGGLCSGGAGGTGGKGGYTKTIVKLVAGQSYTLCVGAKGNDGGNSWDAAATGGAFGGESGGTGAAMSGGGAGGGGYSSFALGSTVYIRANGGGGGAGGADGGYYRYKSGETTCMDCSDRNYGAAGGDGGKGGGGTAGGSGSDACAASGGAGGAGSYYINSSYAILVSGIAGNRSGNGYVTIKYIANFTGMPSAGNCSVYTPAVTGNYQIELKGASGGNGFAGLCSGGNGGTGGKGGYVKLKMKLTAGQNYTVCAGAQGATGGSPWYGSAAGGLTDGGAGTVGAGVSGNGGGGGGSSYFALGSTVYARANGGGGGAGGTDGGYYRYQSGETTCVNSCSERNYGGAGGDGGTGGGGTTGGAASTVCSATGSNGSDGTYYINTSYATLVSGSNGLNSGNGSANIEYIGG